MNINTIIYNTICQAFILGFAGQIIAFVLVLIATPIIFLVRRQKRVCKTVFAEESKAL
jgi:hypothetical protein